MNTSTIILLFVISIITPLSLSINTFLKDSNSIKMAENNQPSSSSVYIVYTQPPSSGDDLQASQLRTLSSVLGSEEAAKEALIYVYKNAATGFSAKLTPEQVKQLEKQPGVLQIVADQPLHLHSPGGVMNV